MPPQPQDVRPAISWRPRPGASFAPRGSRAHGLCACPISSASDPSSSRRHTRHVSLGRGWGRFRRRRKPLSEFSFLVQVDVAVPIACSGGRNFGVRGVPRPEGGPIDPRDSAHLQGVDITAIRLGAAAVSSSTTGRGPAVAHHYGSCHSTAGEQSLITRRARAAVCRYSCLLLDRDIMPD